MTSETSTTARETTRRTNGTATVLPVGAMQGTVHEVRGVLEDVGRAMPEVARASRSAIGDLFATIEAGSDERVWAGVTLSLGLAIGMLIGGAPRLLIALALAPLVAMGIVLADRRAAGARGAKASS